MAVWRAFFWLADLFRPDPLESSDIAAYCRREGVDLEALRSSIRHEARRGENQALASRPEKQLGQKRSGASIKSGPSRSSGSPPHRNPALLQ